MCSQRGRPREYDRETALEAACQVFWKRGFHDASLDELSAAMGMNRPSIYNAFGAKEAIYREAIAFFTAEMRRGFERTIGAGDDFRASLRKFYRAAIDTYTTNGESLGCMVICTAPSAAMVHSEVQSDLRAIVGELDARLRSRIEMATQEGQLKENTDAKMLGSLIQAVLHSLAIRARAGESKASLRRLSDAAVDTFFD